MNAQESLLINPLKKLHAEKNITYAEMARLTGLHLNNIYRIRDITDPKEFLKLEVGTLMALHKELNINLLESIQYE